MLRSWIRLTRRPATSLGGASGAKTRRTKPNRRRRKPLDRKSLLSISGRGGSANKPKIGRPAERGAGTDGGRPRVIPCKACSTIPGAVLRDVSPWNPAEDQLVSGNGLVTAQAELHRNRGVPGGIPGDACPGIVLLAESLAASSRRPWGSSIRTCGRGGRSSERLDTISRPWMSSLWKRPARDGSDWAGLHSGGRDTMPAGSGWSCRFPTPRPPTWWRWPAFAIRPRIARGRLAGTGMRRSGRSVAWGPVCPDRALRAWGQQAVSRLQSSHETRVQPVDPTASRDAEGEHVVIGRLIRRMRISDSPGRFQTLATNVLRTSLGMAVVAWVPSDGDESVVVSGEIEGLRSTGFRTLLSLSPGDSTYLANEPPLEASPPLPGVRGLPLFRPEPRAGSSRSTRSTIGRSAPPRSSGCSTWRRSSLPSRATLAPMPSSRNCSLASSGP